MERRYLRSRNNGVVFDWDPILAQNPACVEITEMEAFPERFMPETAIKRRGRKPRIDLETKDISDPPHYTDPELAKAASMGLP